MPVISPIVLYDVAPSGYDAIDDIELQRDVSAVSEDARDASVVFVAHHNRRHRFIDIERAIVESAYLTKFTSGIVYTNKCAICF